MIEYLNSYSVKDMNNDIYIGVVLNRLLSDGFLLLYL